MEDKIRYPEIDSFIRKTVKRESGLLKDMEETAHEAFIPILAPDSAAFLKTLIKLAKPHRILEAGTAIGYSASIMAHAMDNIGTVDTIEIDEEMAEEAEKNIIALGLERRIRVLRGDALEVMQCLSSTYDLIFLDAPKGQYMEYLNEALRLVKTNGIILSDNILFKGLVAEEGTILHKHRTITMRLKEYLNHLCHHPQLETSIIPIGDGMALSVKLY